MLFDTPIPLLLNTFTLSLAMSFLIILLWYDLQRIVNRFFGLFLVLVICWNLGALLSELTTIISDEQSLEAIARSLTTIGFIGSSVVLYAMVTVIAGEQPRRFSAIVFLYLTLVVIYTLFSVNQSFIADDSPTRDSFTIFFFLVFDTIALYIIWRYRQKLRSWSFSAGVILYVLGQVCTLSNYELGVAIFSTSISSFGAVVISFSIVQRELISPLLGRRDQLEAMHRVSVAITSRFATDAVLSEIAKRAADWLDADGAGIYLKNHNELQLVAIHNLPETVLGYTLHLGEGIAGTAAQTKKSVYLENYSRDWDHAIDMPLADRTFGSTIAVPLIYGDDVIGTLIVIAGLKGTLLEPDDVNLLELLASQAAVAISHGQLFSEQKKLTTQLEAAHDQLKTVLVSTESPVVAVDRQMRLIFANPAAEHLLNLDDTYHDRRAIDMLPEEVLPDNYRQVLRDIHRNRAHSYEVKLDKNYYLCHLASLGDERIEGWVAVLNDITELKELDRIKSEMVRMTSHDLKNPLQAAMANLELLRDDVSDIQDAEITLSVDNIEKQLNKMNRIIRGILDLERVRMSMNPVEECEPTEIIYQAINELSDMIADSDDLHVEVDIEPEIRNFRGDKEKFERAMINLIENAIKFNKTGGTVRITVENKNQDILFSVSDDGIGIPEELHMKVFDRFYRGHQPGAEHISGTGLGLSLVKAVVDSHHGEIWVESQPSVGTTFYISVPAASSLAK